MRIALTLLTLFSGVACNDGSADGTGAPRTLREFRFARTSERIEHGRYLVTVAQCFDCHSPIDSALFLPLPGREGSGDIIDSAGPLVAPNITPDPETGAGRWTDDMFVRAIREGFGHDGRTLHSAMRSEYFSILTDEDVASIVVYLRSIPPVKHELPRVLWPGGQLGFRDEIVEDSVATCDTTVARGAYLARIALCEHCHSPRDSAGRRKPGLRFAGGTVGVADPLHPVVSKNITPDPSGISYYDEDLFVQTIHTGRVGGVRQLDPWMPWPYLRVMTDDDLSALFGYLRTLQPVHHNVDNTEPPQPCLVCGVSHGLGNLH